MTDDLDGEGIAALAAKVEAATGPDRELDCRVAAACHPSMAGEFRVVGPPTYAEPRFFSQQKGMDWIGYDLLNNAPAYTASLDAAMTLVPKGCVAVFTNCDVVEPAPDFSRCTAMVGAPDDPGKPSVAATPALALTAACLRALSARLSAREEGI